MSDIAWWVYVVWAAVGIGIGWWIGSIKGYPLLGAVLGIFTIIGWIIIALLPARGSRGLPESTVLPHHDSVRPPDLPSEHMPPHPRPSSDPHDRSAS